MKRIMFKKRHPPVGARPGTLVIENGAARTRLRAMSYTPDALEEREIEGPAALDSIPASSGVTWIDARGLGTRSALEQLGERFEIHPLALEDVVNVPQRPKTEEYPGHQLFITRLAWLDPDGQLRSEQVSIFFSSDFVLSFLERESEVLEPVRARLRQARGNIRRSRGDYLAYAILDTIIDHYFPLVERASEILENIEEEVMIDPRETTLARINRAKRDLVHLRRNLWPQRDALNALVRGDSPHVSAAVQVFLRDSYDHCIQLTEVIDMGRELAAGLFNTYLSVVSQKTNEVMKVLTIMASIFIPLTFLAGIYGMNFESMPELRSEWGYPVLLAIMALTGLGMVLFFRRRGWLGPRGEGRDGIDSSRSRES